MIIVFAAIIAFFAGIIVVLPVAHWIAGDRSYTVVDSYYFTFGSKAANARRFGSR